MNDNQLIRYSPQIMLPQFDIAGQQRLLASHALIIGLGGLGSPVAMYLAASGVGQLTLVDDDTVLHLSAFKKADGSNGNQVRFQRFSARRARQTRSTGNGHRSGGGPFLIE